MSALFARLDDLGLSVDREYVTSLAGGIPSRKHVAAGLVRAGHVVSDDEAFARFLNEDARHTSSDTDRPSTMRSPRFATPAECP